MRIEIETGFAYRCDAKGCDAVLATEKHTLCDAADVRKREGWMVHTLPNGLWQHVCPACEATKAAAK